jgi:dTDP-4-amino-4,6-dideoxygalactose transaminase
LKATGFAGGYLLFNKIMKSKYPSIPFNKASLGRDELDYVNDAIMRGHISGDGFYTRLCTDHLENLLEVPRVLLTTSCTHALEMAAILLNIGPGDEVIVPSFTFVSTAMAFALHGARIVFADIRPDTLNIDESELEGLISCRTKAIVVVHYGGVSCEMSQILDICSRWSIALIEDNAHGLFGKYRDQYLGTFGSLATLSFHETKNFTCGEGGALLINDPNLIERAEIIRQKGTNRINFLKGEVDKYTWIDIGSSYVLSDMLAAMLWAQFQREDAIQSRRKEIWMRYMQSLGVWAFEQSIILPTIPDHCECAWHLFYILFPDHREQKRFIKYMKDHGIMTVFHYVPLNLTPAGLQYGKPANCPRSEQISMRLVRLPFFADLYEQSRVIDVILEYPNGR